METSGRENEGENLYKLPLAVGGNLRKLPLAVGVLKLINGGKQGEVAQIRDLALARFQEMVLKDVATPSTGGIEFLKYMQSFCESLKMQNLKGVSPETLNAYLIELRNCVVAMEANNLFLCAKEDERGNFDLEKTTFDLLREKDLITLQASLGKWGSMFLAYELPSERNVVRPQVVDLRRIYKIKNRWFIECDVFSKIELKPNFGYRAVDNRGETIHVTPGKVLSSEVRRVLGSTKLIPFAHAPELKSPGGREGFLRPEVARGGDYNNIAAAA